MSTHRPDNPLIVQGDLTVLVEVDSPRYQQARDALLAFAELVKSPEHVHTYRISPLSIWNACAAGHDASAVATYNILTHRNRRKPRSPTSASSTAATGGSSSTTRSTSSPRRSSRRQPGCRRAAGSG